MIIKKLEIENFRSYYKYNVFEFNIRLNLIIGANGDGKTTLFDAIDWLFRTDNTNKMSDKLISRKRFDELFADESDNVRVALTYEHDGKLKVLEKTFMFTKSLDGQAATSNYGFTLIEQNGVERIEKDGNLFEYDFPSDIRKYSMFKGEGDLDVFQRSNALKNLIDTFSDVRDFESYSNLLDYSVKHAEQARDNAQKLDRKNEEKIRGLRRTISTETSILGDIDRELKTKSEEVTNFEQLLKNIEQSQEASKLLKNVNDRINSLNSMRWEKQLLIKENYSTDLLDKLWVLMGFEPIAKEYSDKVNAFDRDKRSQEQKHILKYGMQKEKEKMQTAFTPLPAHIPGPNILKEMLDDEVCKVCGRPAPKGSEAWNFMAQKLQDYYDSLKEPVKDEDAEYDIPPLFHFNYIGELQKRDTTLTDNLDKITKKRQVVLDRISLNNRLHNDIKKIDENLNQAFEQKKRILSQADGLTEEQLMANFNNISSWMDKQKNAKSRIETLRSQKLVHQAALDDAQNKLSQLAEGTETQLYVKAWQMINNIKDAFNAAKELNKQRLMEAIEEKANEYLDRLNIDDFKGRILIVEKADGQGEAVLSNADGTRIFNPNTALRTTYLMSVLFAIGQLSSERNETEFPLIFDAPTSSFTSAKESEFFKVIGQLNKQVIIVTKSFLKEEADGRSSLDSQKINNIEGSVYHIEKKRPFNDRDLGTIQTVITKIK